MSARQIEHANSQDKGIARRSSRAKDDSPPRIHDGMASRTRGTLGGPTQGKPPDASSPMPTDHFKQNYNVKTVPVPKMAFGMKSDPERGSYDANLAEAVMNEAHRSPDDFARNLRRGHPTGKGEEIIMGSPDQPRDQRGRWSANGGSGDPSKEAAGTRYVPGHGTVSRSQVVAKHSGDERTGHRAAPVVIRLDNATSPKDKTPLKQSARRERINLNMAQDQEHYPSRSARQVSAMADHAKPSKTAKGWPYNN